MKCHAASQGMSSLHEPVNEQNNLVRMMLHWLVGVVLFLFNLLRVALCGRLVCVCCSGGTFLVAKKVSKPSSCRMAVWHSVGDPSRVCSPAFPNKQPGESNFYYWGRLLSSLVRFLLAPLGSPLSRGSLGHSKIREFRIGLDADNKFGTANVEFWNAICSRLGGPLSGATDCQACRGLT